MAWGLCGWGDGLRRPGCDFGEVPWACGGSGCDAPSPGLSVESCRGHVGPSAGVARCPAACCGPGAAACPLCLLYLERGPSWSQEGQLLSGRAQFLGEKRPQFNSLFRRCCLWVPLTFKVFSFVLLGFSPLSFVIRAAKSGDFHCSIGRSRLRVWPARVTWWPEWKPLQPYRRYLYFAHPGTRC